MSVESGPVYSKGMVIINRKSEEKQEVLLNIFDKINFPDSGTYHNILS